MVLRYVIGILLSSAGVVMLAHRREKWEFLGFLLTHIGGIVVGTTMVLRVESESPTALDVYRGRTELEITEVVRDTVVIKRDTVVVVFIDK